MPDAGEAKTALSGGAGGGGGGYPSKRLRSPERTRCGRLDCHAGDQAWELRAKGEIQSLIFRGGDRLQCQGKAPGGFEGAMHGDRLLFHGGGAEGLTTRYHPESGAIGASYAHQQQHTRRLLTSCARAGLLTSNSTFGDFAEGGKVDIPHSAARRILPSVRQTHIGNDNNNTRCE